jgi:thioredoxin 1
MSETVQQVQESRFEAEVLKSNVPVVVDFYADWCGPCRIVSPIIEQLSREFAGKAKFVKVNTDENQELAAKYGIMSIPTIMFFSGGKVKDVVVGAAPASVYRQKLNSILKS